MAKRGKENIDPDLEDFKLKKRRKLAPSDRFKVSSDQVEIDRIKKGYVPMNTQKSTNWAVKVFNEWRGSRSSLDDGECPSDLLEVGDADKLNFWLPRFINEVRRTDGNAYPPRTFHQLLAGIQRSMLEKNHCLPKFLDRSNPVFHPIHGACDSVYHDLHCSGVGVRVRHTPIILEEEEAKLWEYGLLGVDNPKSLQRAVFYFVGKRFCIRGGALSCVSEQRALGPSNFICSYDPDCITYVEHGSKNYCARARTFALRTRRCLVQQYLKKGPSVLLS